MLPFPSQELRDAVRRQQVIDLRSMKRPSRIDELEASLVKPYNPLPPNPLPRWLNLQLNVKFPLPKAPPGDFPISKGKLGKSIFTPNCGHPFDITDPYMRHTPHEYEPLHDPSLRSYFSARPNLIATLMKEGILSCDTSVISSLAGFNKYRDYLSRLHGECVAAERDRRAKFEYVANQQTKQIYRSFNKECEDKKNADAAARLRIFRKQKANQDILIHLKKERQVNTDGVDKLALERSLARKHREFLNFQRILRVAERDRANLDTNRANVMEWYCRDLYVEKMRLAMARWKEEMIRLELEDFVRAKREFQEQKLRYERAILLKDKLERECAVIKRSLQYAKLEALRRTGLARKLELERKREARALYLISKYGRRWITIVQNKRKAVATYHDSLWASRGQLRDLVAVLREESGTQSFTAFIKDLIKLKPGRVVIENEETREVITYILNLLIRNTFREFTRKRTSCFLDFWEEETRIKLGRMKCPKGDMLQLEDFIPPEVRKRFRPRTDFVKPPWSCPGTSSELKPKAKEPEDSDWPNKCHQMASCLTKCHDTISKHIFETKCHALSQAIFETPKKHHKEIPLPSDKLATPAPAPQKILSENFSRVYKPASEPDKSVLDPSPQKILYENLAWVDNPTSAKSTTPLPPSRIILSEAISSVDSLTSDMSLLPSQQLLSDNLSSADNQTSEFGKSALVPPPEKTASEDFRWVKAPTPAKSAPQLLRKISSEDLSWVDKIIIKQQQILQEEKDIVGQGDEEAVDNILDKNNISRVVSLIMKNALCEKIDELQKEIDEYEKSHCNSGESDVVKPQSPDTSYVDHIISEQRETLQEERDRECESSEQCDEARKPRPSDYSYVDHIINEQRETLQEERDRECKSNEECNESRKSRPSDYSYVDHIINEQRDALQQERDKKCKDCDESQLVKPRPSDYSFVDHIINEQRDALQRERDQECEDCEEVPPKEQRPFSDDS